MYAVMAELADVQDLGSCVARRVGSTPTNRMNKGFNLFITKIKAFYFFTFCCTIWDVKKKII